MDNNTLAITVSAGVIGATLAYLGYNNYRSNGDDDEGDDDRDNKIEILKNLRADVPSPTNQVVSSKSPVHKKNLEEVEAKQEVKQVVKSEWGKFWQGEYDSQQTQTNAPQEIHPGTYH